MSLPYLHTFINDFSTTLSTSYTAGGTSLSLASFTGSNGLSLPTDGGVFYLKIEDEYFLVTANSGSNPLTVVGGQCGSTNVSHGSGTVVTGCWILPPVLNAIRDFRADIMSGKPFGIKGSQKNEAATFNGGATVDLLSTVTGSGFVDFMWIGATRTSTVKVYIDGEGSPSISIDCRDMTFGRRNGAVFSHSTFLANSVDSGTAGVSGFSFVPIPFSTSIRITITNDSANNDSIYSYVTYQTGIPNNLPYQQKLYINAGVISGATPNQVCTLLDYTGGKRGRLLGVYWSLDGPSQNLLEGNFKIYRDGAGTPFFETPGSEDFFCMPAYFASFNAPTEFGNSIGLTLKNNAGGQFTAYRMFLKDPIVFNTGCKVTWNAGDTAQQNWTGTCDVYYSIMYYTEL